MSPSFTCVSMQEVSWWEGGRDKADANDTCNKVVSALYRRPIGNTLHNISAVRSDNQPMHSKIVLRTYALPFSPPACFLFHFTEGKSTYNHKENRYVPETSFFKTGLKKQFLEWTLTRFLLKWSPHQPLVNSEDWILALIFQLLSFM